MQARHAAGGAAPLLNQVVAALQPEPSLRDRGIVSLARFGAIVRGTARPDSDMPIALQAAGRRMRERAQDLARV